MRGEVNYRIKRYVKGRLGTALTRRTGYYLTRYPPSPLPPDARPLPVDGAVLTASQLAQMRALRGERLLSTPTFILSSPRSGSTLLRVMLNSHSRIHAPHEMHMGDLHVAINNKYATQAMWELGLDQRALQYLLWDRLLQWDLTRSGKELLVNKTPTDVLIWRDIVECWPDAKFVFLLRHPLAVTQSWHRVHQEWSVDRTARDMVRFFDAIEEARRQVPGLTVRYEELTADPEHEMRRLCAFIDVEWEPTVLQYNVAGTQFANGLGDWSDNLKSGGVQAARPLPPDTAIPASLREVSRSWGYLHD